MDRHKGGWKDRQTVVGWMNRWKDRWIDLRIDIKVEEWMVRTFMEQHERKLYFQNALAQLNFIKLTTLLSILQFQMTISLPVGCGQFNLHSWFKKEPIQFWIVCNPGLKSGLYFCSSGGWHRNHFTFNGWNISYISSHQIQFKFTYPSDRLIDTHLNELWLPVCPALRTKIAGPNLFICMRGSVCLCGVSVS